MVLDRKSDLVSYKLMLHVFKSDLTQTENPKRWKHGLYLFVKKSDLRVKEFNPSTLENIKHFL